MFEVALLRYKNCGYVHGGLFLSGGGDGHVHGLPFHVWELALPFCDVRYLQKHIANIDCILYFRHAEQTKHLCKLQGYNQVLCGQAQNRML